MTEEKLTEREQLEINLHHALHELSDYFAKRNDPLQYEVNRMWRQLDKLRDTPEFKKG